MEQKDNLITTLARNCSIVSCKTSNILNDEQYYNHMWKRHRVKRNRCPLGCRGIVAFDEV